MTLVTGAGQNGAHRESARAPKAIEPGRPFPLEIELHFTSWVFPEGPPHPPGRLERPVADDLADAVCDDDDSRTWGRTPRVWFCRWCLRPIGRSRTTCRSTAGESSDGLAGFESLDPGTPSGYGEISSIERNPRTGAAKAVATSSSRHRFPWGEERNTESITYEGDDDTPDKAQVTGEYSTEVKLPDRTLRWESVVVFRSDRTNFYYTGDAAAAERRGPRPREKVGRHDSTRLPITRDE